MAAITDYASLSTEIGSWMKRTYSSAETDGFIGLAEAEFRLYFGPNYAKETSATLTVTSGSAALPTGFVRAIALTHSTYGTLDEVSIRTVRERRIADDSGIPNCFAVTGSTIEVAPSYTGSLTFDYEGTLSGLSGSNTTNWLVTNAPQAYLSMCVSMAKARLGNYQDAAALRQQALQVLADLGVQSVVGQLSRSRVTLPGSTP